MYKKALARSARVAAFCVLVTVGCVPAQARTLMFADSFPLSHTLSTDGTQRWMKQVETLTDGEIDFRHFPAEQLAKAGEILQKIEDGVIQAGYIGTGYVSDELPLNGALMLPGEVRDTVNASQAYWQLLKNDTPLRQEFLDNGVVPIYAVMLPPYQLVLKRGPVSELGDLRGSNCVRRAASIWWCRPSAPTRYPWRHPMPISRSSAARSMAPCCRLRVSPRTRSTKSLRA